MVQNPGKTLRSGALKPVNLPEPVKLDEDSTGRPVAVINGRLKQAVIAIDDQWRIEDEWWRGQTLSRFYYEIRLASGQRLVVYKDLISKSWYKQGY